MYKINTPTTSVFIYMTCLKSLDIRTYFPGIMYPFICCHCFSISSVYVVLATIRKRPPSTYFSIITFGFSFFCSVGTVWSTLVMLFLVERKLSRFNSTVIFPCPSKNYFVLIFLYKDLFYCVNSTKTMLLVLFILPSLS